jgi:hypothetical protein
MKDLTEQLATDIAKAINEFRTSAEPVRASKVTKWRAG